MQQLPAGPVAADADDIDLCSGRKYLRGFVRSYAPGHLIRAVAAARHLRSQKTLDDAALDMIAFLDPSCGQQWLLDRINNGLEFPSQPTLCEARLRLDITRMLWEREQRSAGLDYRFLLYDASPKKGYEIFGVRMDVVLQKHLDVPLRDLREAHACF